MMAMELVAIGPIEENTTEKAGKSEVYPKDSINQNRGNCKPAIRNKLVRHPSP